MLAFYRLRCIWPTIIISTFRPPRPRPPPRHVICSTTLRSISYGLNYIFWKEYYFSHEMTSIYRCRLKTDGGNFFFVLENGKHIYKSVYEPNDCGFFDVGFMLSCNVLNDSPCSVACRMFYQRALLWTTAGLIAVVLTPPTPLYATERVSLHQERPPPNEGQGSACGVPRGARISQAHSVTDSGPIFKSAL